MELEAQLLQSIQRNKVTHYFVADLLSVQRECDDDRLHDFSCACEAMML